MRLTSCQAEIAEAFCSKLAQFIGKRLGTTTEFINDIPWQERERLFDRGDIDVCWTCGLTYVRRSNAELLVAPVMKHPRYGGKPVYFSDVVVFAGSSYSSFEDLRGATWAYNEPGSHSGYNVVRYHLGVMGCAGDYFGRTVESTSHQRSLQLLLNNEIDAASIDSTVLEMELSRNPAIRERIRVITILGPSPAPPWLAHPKVPKNVREALQEAFLSMDTDPEGRQILQSAGMLRFAAVSDRDYDPIREMDRVAATVQWSARARPVGGH